MDSIMPTLKKAKSNEHVKIENVDIYELPEVDPRFSGKPGFEVTIGDLHANTLKLLFLLIKHGIAKGLSKDDYAQLVTIYPKDGVSLTANDLKTIDTILNKIEFIPDTKVRLIGDDLADRVGNDYFTLKLMEKMHDNKVHFESDLSNHGVEFIEACEIQDNFHAPMLLREHANSLENLQILVERGLVTREEVIALANKVYKPALKAISYSVNPKNNKIVIYSHAGIDPDTIKAIATKLGVEYNENELPQTLDKINEKFQEHVQANTVHTLYTRAKMLAGYGGYVDLRDSPFEMLMWNRRYDILNRPAKIGKYKVIWVHGHDSRDPTQKHIINLDNQLGKPTDFNVGNKGNYTVLYSQGKTAFIEHQTEHGLLIESIEADGLHTDDAILPPPEATASILPQFSQHPSVSLLPQKAMQDLAKKESNTSTLPAFKTETKTQPVTTATATAQQERAKIQAEVDAATARAAQERNKKTYPEDDVTIKKARVLLDALFDTKNPMSLDDIDAAIKRLESEQIKKAEAEAAARSKQEQIKAAQEEAVKTEERKYASLFLDISDKAIDKVTKALDNGALVEKTNKSGKTLLQAAVSTYKADNVVNLLLDRGADAKKIGIMQNAILSGLEAKTVERLIIAGADPQYINPLGLNALHHAIILKWGNLVECLLAHHANPNLRSPISGTTPLMLAVQDGGHKLNNVTSVIQQLINNGADVQLVDSTGKKALDYVGYNKFIAGIEHHDKIQAEIRGILENAMGLSPSNKEVTSEEKHDVRDLPKIPVLTERQDQNRAQIEAEARAQQAERAKAEARVRQEQQVRVRAAARAQQEQQARVRAEAEAKVEAERKVLEAEALAKSNERNRVKAALAGFRKQLGSLDNKIENLLGRTNDAEEKYGKDDSKYLSLKSAYDAAKILRKELNDAANVYFNITQVTTEKSYKTFEETCTKSINKAKEKLDIHRGWTQFLANLLIGITTAGLGLLAKGVYNLTTNKSFFFVHQTDSSKVATDFEEQIKNAELKDSGNSGPKKG